MRLPLTALQYLDQLRSQICRMLFPPSAVWLLVFLFPRVIEKLQGLNPFSGGGAPHLLFETAMLWLPVLSALALTVWLLVRNPRFLRLPVSLPATRIMACILVSAIALFVVILVVAVALDYFFREPAIDPQAGIHIRTWLDGVWYATALTPLATTLWVWCALHQERKEGPDVS